MKGDSEEVDGSSISKRFLFRSLCLPKCDPVDKYVLLADGIMCNLNFIGGIRIACTMPNSFHASSIS